MAKTKGPLLSLDAHGSLAKELTYSSKRTGKQCRQYNKPTGPASAKQRGIRRLTEFLIAQWQNMSPGDKATWEANAKATGLRLPGYHYFLREAHRNLYTHTGLVGYWHCNEVVTAKVLDLSGNGNHGILSPGYPGNAPLLVASESTRVGHALYYDGTDDYVNCMGQASLVMGLHDWYMEALIKKDQAGADQYILRHGSGAADYWFFRISAAEKLQFLVQDSVGGIRWDESNITVNGDYHWVAVNVDRSGNMTLWIDAVLVATVDFSPLETDSIDPDGNLTIAYQSDPLKGIIDEVCIYNRNFSPAEILARHRFAIAKV